MQAYGMGTGRVSARLATGTPWPSTGAGQKPASRRAQRTGAKQAKIGEYSLHRTIAGLLDWILPPQVVWTTFPAGWGKMTPAMAGMLYSCGLKRGMPDILVFHKGYVLGIELKRPGAGPSRAQIEMIAKLKAAGVPVFIAHSPEDVISALKCMKVPMRSKMTMDSQLLGSVI
jgi:hypothetical protein